MSRGEMIARKVSAAIKKAAKATGDGPYIGYIVRPGALNENTVPVTRQQDVEHSCFILVTQFSTMDRAANSSITEKDVKLMIATEGLTVVPQNEDKFRFDGETDVFSLENVTAMQPGGVVHYWTARVRRS